MTSGGTDHTGARPPLDGIRAIVLTHAWIGTYCTELLGLNGAEVIQVETSRRIDSWRGGGVAPIPEALKDVPTAQHSWNSHWLYNSVNLNKRCITLDLQSPQGIDIFRRLVPFGDVVAENFSPRVVGNLGIDYEALKAIKPDLVMISLNAYGTTGPWRDTLGIGGTLEPTSGQSSLMGYRDQGPTNSGQMLPDPIGGSYGYNAIVTALLHRARTGEGQYIDLSMLEANHSVVGDAALEYAVTGNVRGRLGNRHLTFAPHGIYPAQGPSAEPNDQWLALAAESEQQWAALREIAGSEGVTSLDDPRFATNEGRKQHEDDLDAAIAAWTAGQHRDALAARLTAAGLRAAPVHDAHEVAADPVFRERGSIADVTHPETGTHPQTTLPYRYSRTPTPVTRHAPMLGEHTAEVLEQYLDIGADEYAELEARGITGTEPVREE
ncbi:MAG TPA: CoA transferase [Dehalococcoidia bacterium]|nr:CoA transferase [Dehalococcoidia bacterium]